MKRVIPILIVSVVLIGGIAFQLKNNHEKINKVEATAGISNVVNVNVAKVMEKAPDHEIQLTGTLYPRTELDISAQTQGQITVLDVELGAFKKRDAILATLDDELKQLNFESARLNATKLQRNYERIENLYRGGSATEQQLDDARIAFETAKIQLQQAEKQLADATVSAPFNGIVTQKYVEEGAFINVGNPILRLVDISSLKVKVNVSESNIYHIKKGNVANVFTDVYPGTVFPGLVTYVSDRGDESHHYALEVEIPNPKQHPLKAGTIVRVNVNVPSAANGLFIPREALVGSVQNASVYLAENNIARLKKITVKDNSASELQVLSGLTEGAEVIVAGQINLIDGTHIHVVEN